MAVMVNVAVVEDDMKEQQRLRRCLDVVAERTGYSFGVRAFSTAEAFLMEYRVNAYNLVFMDIQFPPGFQDGMSAARELRELDQTVVLVFVTNLVQLAVQGYEVEALDFMVKPLEPETFYLKMLRVLKRVGSYTEDVFPVKSEGSLVSLHSSTVRCVEVDGHYCIYHAAEGTFREYITLTAVQKKLGNAPFVRCDRGVLVNLRYVTSVTADVCMVDQLAFPIARDRRAAFKKAFAEYLGGRVASA